MVIAFAGVRVTFGGLMAADLSRVMSNAGYHRLETLWRNRTLMPRYSRTLFEIWCQDKPNAIKRAGKASTLIPLPTSHTGALIRAP